MALDRVLHGHLKPRSEEEVLQAQLQDALSALDASRQAVRTHGHQGISWACLKADAERVAQLQAELARRSGEGK
jgi:hypothetical protein